MSDDGLRSNVFKLIIHPNYDDGTFENNIAMLMLETQIKFSAKILPICLPPPGAVLKEIGTIVGFGRTETNRHGSVKYREAELAIVSNEECDDKAESSLNQENFCAGRADGMKNVCDGDDGKNSILVTKN